MANTIQAIGKTSELGEVQNIEIHDTRHASCETGGVREMFQAGLRGRIGVCGACVHIR